MAMLISTSLIMLYLNRGVVFEQRLSVNQLRSSIAFETAEAGIAWVTASLNSPAAETANCAALATQTFRHKYLQSEWQSEFDIEPLLSINTSATPGCHIERGNWSCECPNGTTVDRAAGTDATWGHGSGTPSDAMPSPAFTASFLPTRDPEAVRVAVTGCSAIGSTCTTTNSAIAEASATIAITLKWRPALQDMPSASLTCGKTCTLASSYQVINQDYATAGLLVHAGAGIVELSLPTYITLPLQANSAAKVFNDSALSALAGTAANCKRSNIFESYFGTTMGEYASAPDTLALTQCSESAECDAILDTAYAAGWRSFYLPQGYKRQSDKPLGSATDPVLLVSALSVTTPNVLPAPNTPAAISGLVFINSEEEAMPSSLDVSGAVISCGDFTGTGHGRIEYQPQVLERIRRNIGRMVRVPGSWTDLCKLTDSTPPLLRCPESQP